MLDAIKIVLLMVAAAGTLLALFVSLRMAVIIFRMRNTAGPRAVELGYNLSSWWNAQVTTHNGRSVPSTKVVAGLGARMGKDGKPYIASEQAPTRATISR